MTIPTRSGSMTTSGGALAVVTGTDEEEGIQLIDGFEQYDGTNTVLSDNYYGDTTAIEVVDESTVTPNAIYGTQMIQFPVEVESRIVSEAGLPNYLSKGEAARVWIHYTDNAESRTHFGLSNTSNYYDVRIDLRGSSEVVSSLVSVGGAGVIDDAHSWSGNETPNQWIYLDIVWDDGTLGGAEDDITVTIHEENGDVINQLAANNADHTSDGMAWRQWKAVDGERLYYDYAHLPEEYSTGEDTVSEFIIDDFEGYTVGNRVRDEAPEWGHAQGGHLEVSDSFSAEGQQSATDEGVNTYETIHSGTDASVVTSQDSTFEKYPYAPATVRLMYGTDTSEYIDSAIAVPETESNFNDNCYRVRGGTNTAPFLRRTVNGSSTELASMAGTLSDYTWYDIALSFRATGSAVDLSLRIWEWTGTEWVEFESEITATDTDNAHPDAGGIGIGIANSSSGGDLAHLDYHRFYDEYRYNDEPEVEL